MNSLVFVYQHHITKYICKFFINSLIKKINFWQNLSLKNKNNKLHSQKTTLKTKINKKYLINLDFLIKVFLMVLTCKFTRSVLSRRRGDGSKVTGGWRGRRWMVVIDVTRRRWTVVGCRVRHWLVVVIVVICQRRRRFADGVEQWQSAVAGPNRCRFQNNLLKMYT